MTLKKLSTSIVGMMIALTLIVLPTFANADVDVPAAQIVKIGVNPDVGGSVIRLVDLGATPEWTNARNFVLGPLVGNQGLAVALTALSLGKTIWVRIDGDASANSDIKIIFMNE